MVRYLHGTKWGVFEGEERVQATVTAFLEARSTESHDVLKSFTDELVRLFPIPIA